MQGFSFSKIYKLDENTGGQTSQILVWLKTFLLDLKNFGKKTFLQIYRKRPEVSDGDP